jgi:pimeloyl-ACP methyl ester carboxylesterase
LAVSVEGVVLVHGANHSAACWNALLAHLLMPAVTVDLPGRGGRPADLAAVTLDDCVQAVIDSADRARLERFVLVGHSLGGLTITETACRFPQRAVGLVYVAGTVPAPGESAAIAITGANMPLGESHMPKEAIAKQYFGNDLTDEQWAQHWKELVPEATSLWNSQLNRYPDGVPITYVSMTDDVGVPLSWS